MSLRFLVFSVLFVLPYFANAHFKLNLNIRIVHVEHHEHGLDVFMRVPMPYLLATLVGPEQVDGARVAAPFTHNKMVDGELMHYVDYSAVLQRPLGLGQLAADGHQIIHDAQPLTATVLQVLVYSGQDQPPFSTLDEAKRAFTDNDMLPIEPAPFVGDVVVDVQLSYKTENAVDSYQLLSTLDPGLPGQEETANLIIDYGLPQPQVFRVRGLLQEPLSIGQSQFQAASTFVIEGIRHILAGYDHVLFVICLVIGSMAITELAWRVTGFTLGHSITLSLGFFGYTPQAAWFVPAVESLIAISIIYAAILALTATGRHRSGFVMTCLIGMVHGLGFSFVLQEILGVSAPNIWLSLLAFNLGVEFGQLAIVLMVWPAVFLLVRRQPRIAIPLKWLIAVPCIGIASLWLGQRLSDVLVSV